MKFVAITIFLVGAVCWLCAAHGRSHHYRKKKNATDLTIVDCWSQRLLPGRREASVSAPTLHFLVVWLAPTFPETFFWRGTTGWQNCNIERAKSSPVADFQQSRGMPKYDCNYVQPEKIIAGDTLMIVPVVGGKFPIPKEISDTMHNLLFYKTGGGDWRYLRIDNIRKERDIVAP